MICAISITNDSGKVNGSQKRSVWLVKSLGNSSKTFYLLEEIFNQMTLCIKDPVATLWIYSVGFWWNGAFAILTLDIIVGLVFPI